MCSSISGGHTGELWGPVHWSSLEGLSRLRHFCHPAHQRWKKGSDSIRNANDNESVFFLWVYVKVRRHITSQVILKPIVPHTQKEQVEYSVAAERRRVRMVHDDIIRDLLSHGSIQQGRHTHTHARHITYHNYKSMKAVNTMKWKWNETHQGATLLD